MSSRITMVFIDLAGSTAAYETLGNDQVAEVISQITRWAGAVCEAHGGHTVKFLGDGVLAEFISGAHAIEAAIHLQQQHTERLQKWPEPLRMGLKIGLGCGDVVHRDEDVYGDPVNLAARLSDMAGIHGIWADESVINELSEGRQTLPPQTQGPAHAVRYRSLGKIHVRGLAEARLIFQIEWDEDASTDLMTVRGLLTDEPPAHNDGGGSITLSGPDSSHTFNCTQLPILIGRDTGSDFVVRNPQVSRTHARLEKLNGAFVLTDLSSFGTWVRFKQNPEVEVQLRRNQCVLHTTGEIAFGTPFEDPSAPIVIFHIQSQDAKQNEQA